MNNPSTLLSIPYDRGAFSCEGKALVIGLEGPQEFLSGFDDYDAFNVFAPYAYNFQKNGMNVLNDFDDLKQNYDHILMVIPKNMTEARYWLARAMAVLKPSGNLVCAGDNKAGGGRLKKLYQDMDFSGIYDDTKKRMRVVWAQKSDGQNIPENWIDDGKRQNILDGEFMSQPGVFGWNKIDPGSDILAQLLPDDLGGRGADFGCGYGFLSREILNHCRGVKMLYCLDADARAVRLCAENMAEFSGCTSFDWCDLTIPQPDLNNLDFIVMNPPFHEGQRGDPAIGNDFIRIAHACLKPGGALFMVANAHLPYEETLKSLFTSGKKLFEGHGFKVYGALK